MHPELFTIGPITLHTYGFLVACAFLAGYFFSRREFERNGLTLDAFDKVITLLMIAGLFGARLFYTFLDGRSTFMDNPISFFKIWEGGLVLYGGVVVGLIVLIIFAKRNEIPLLAMGDSFAGPMLLSQSIGRIGCFAAGCCFGRPTESFVGVTFTDAKSLAPTEIALHPTQLYSSLGNFLLFLGILWLSRKRRDQGFLLSCYLIGYGFFRFLIEFVRDDFRGDVILSLQPSQWISILLIVSGGVLMAYVKKQSSE